MANSLVTCSILAKEALAVLENMLTFSANVNRDFQEEFGGNMSRGYAPGQTINIEKPPRYTYRAGRVAVPQSTTITTVPLTLSQGGTDINFNSFERTLSLTSQKMQNKLQAAMATIANEIDRQGLTLAHFSTPNSVGTPGTPPATQLAMVQLLADAQRRLDEEAAPRDRQRTLIMSPALNATLVAGFSGLFNNAGQLDKQYKSGMFVDAIGFNTDMDQNVDRHTNGTQAVAGVNINGANQTGSSVTTVALTGGGVSLTRGTIITLPGCFAVNPQSRQSTGVLRQFVVTADCASGATSIPISPAIIPSGAFQNVTASPTTGAPFLVYGTVSAGYDCNVAYHRDAFTLATVPLYAPPGGKGVIDSSTQSYRGMNLRVIEFYDGVNDNYIMRFDVLFGWAATYPELSTRIAI
jgi:hypothetical protein